MAVDTETKTVLAVGAEAKEMIGKTPGKIVAIRPMKDGVIADYDMTTDLLKQIMKQEKYRVYLQKTNGRGMYTFWFNSC